MALAAAAGWAVATAACHHSALPPRPDGAAVVIAPGAAGADADLTFAPEVEPNDALPSAQRLPVAAGAPAGVAGSLHPPAGGKRDNDLYRIDIPLPDGGVTAPPVAVSAPRGPDGGPVADGAVAAPVAPPLRRSLRIDLRPEAGVAATLEALDDAGKVLISAPPGQAGEAIGIPNLTVTPGVYYLRVRGAGADAAGGYRLAARLGTFDAGAEVEPNGSAALATDLAPGGEAVGYLGWRHDQDWYRLATASLPEGSVLSADLDPIPGVSASLAVFDGEQRKLTETHGRKEDRVALRNVRVPAGDSQVFLVVRADGGSNADARYSLRTRAELPRAGGEAEPNDDPAHAQPIADASTQLGYLSVGDVDLYRYTAAGPTELDVEVEPPERVDVKLEILREDGTRLARSDVGRRREAERIPNLYLAGGSVLIRLSAGRGDGNPDEPYRLTATGHPPQPGAEREPNDSIATPTTLGAGEMGNGLIAPRGDVDFWKVAAAPDAAGGVTINVGGVAGLTLAVRVLADSGKELARAKVSGEAPVAIRAVTGGAGGEGCCFVEVREAGGKGANARDRYTLGVAK